MLVVSTDSKYKISEGYHRRRQGQSEEDHHRRDPFGGADSIAIYSRRRPASSSITSSSTAAARSMRRSSAAISKWRFTNPGEALELYKAGKVKILGVLSDKRLPGAPEIPTMKEQGINALYVQNRGLIAPADIPADARVVLEQAFFKYTQTDGFKKYCKDNMLSEAWMDGNDFGKFLDGMERQIRRHPQGHGCHEEEMRGRYMIIQKRSVSGAAAANPAAPPPRSGIMGSRARSTRMSATNAAPACAPRTVRSTPSRNRPTSTNIPGRFASTSATRNPRTPSPASRGGERRNPRRTMSPCGVGPGEVGVAIEVGRPTLGMSLRDVQKITRAIARTGVHKIEPTTRSTP